ncbi:MAG: hypothetical protein M0R77_00425 [Gammaproteobacteria bacterium]|nr:hypothetical protein [Acholeplasmataceae bacterium]MCK9529019.1 hypothetical protein [Gammaproteobacteria bacterium]
MSQIKDIEISISGGNNAVREAVADEVGRALDLSGFSNISNIDIDASEQSDSLSLLERATNRYPDLLATSITITTISDPSEVEEEVTEVEEEPEFEEG